jgi:hypothetical protein
MGAFGYRMGDLDEMAEDCVRSAFTLKAPHRPSHAEYRAMIAEIMG